MRPFTFALLAVLTCAFAGPQDVGDADEGPILPAELSKHKTLAAAEKGGRPVFLFIYSDACAVCKKTAPGVITVARLLGDHVGLVMCDVRKKPDETVEVKYKLSGGTKHHISVLQTTAVGGQGQGQGGGGRPGRMLPGGGAPAGAPPGWHEVREETPYNAYVTQFQDSYMNWLQAKTMRAVGMWNAREQIKEQAGNDQSNLRYYASRYAPNGTDPIKWLEADAFEGLSDPACVEAILEAILETKYYPQAPLVAIARIGKVGFKTTPQQWAQKGPSQATAWLQEWVQKWAESQMSAVYKQINDCAIDLTDRNRFTGWSAGLELERLTGQDFIFDPKGPDDEKKALQKVWRDWYVEARRTKALVWNPAKGTFAPDTAEEVTAGGPPAPAEPRRGDNGAVELDPEKVKVLVPTSEADGQAWRYAVEGPGEGWAAGFYDDSAWATGEAGFGIKGTEGAQVRTEWGSRNIWMRRTFEVERNPDGRLHIRVHHGGETWVYLNGARIARLRGSSAGYVYIPVEGEARRALVPGRNTLAVLAEGTDESRHVDAGLVVAAE